VLNKELHRSILIDVLKEIYSDSSLGPILGFKGGTALYLFHNLDRFSVDLDFNLLDLSVEEKVFQRILEIVKSYGALKDHAIKRFGALIAINYSKGNHRLKLDISNRQTNDSYELRLYLGIPVKVMVLEDMAANKLMALTERKTPAARDVFDMNFILKNYIDINEKLIKDRLNRSLKDQLTYSIDYLEDNFKSNLLDGLGELVEDKQKAWIQNKMKEDTIMRLKLRLDSLNS
jgi:predicted nucleotidyltransferase component of viral defense system